MKTMCEPFEPIQKFGLAGEPELAMAAKVVERPILVYQTSSMSIFSRQLKKTSEYGVDEFPNVPPICVLFADYHYDSLLTK